MKKLLKKSLVLFLALIFVVMSVLPVAASQATSYSYTLDDEGELVRTQDAYLPDRTITNLGLSDPEDMIIDDENNAYIVDTGNARVLVYNLDDEKEVTQIDGKWAIAIEYKAGKTLEDMMESDMKVLTHLREFFLQKVVKFI